ncbi:MAG: glucose 1-dehydrogenase [Myxococcota bacterium]
MSILDRFKVTDRVAVITGAGRGIGRGIAIGLAEAGADVVLAARRENTLEEVASIVEKAGRRALVVPTDALVPEQLDRLAERALEEFGGVDFLVNNVGGTLPGPALQCSDAEFNKSFNFNVTTALHMSRLLAPSMAERGHGSIVNISSGVSHLVDRGFVAYGTAKAAMSHMTRLLAHEWAPHVRVNAIAVGATETDALAMVTADRNLSKQMEDLTPMGRLGTVEDIAAAALYLLSDAGSWVTGKNLEVDGGTVASNWPFSMPSGLSGPADAAE